MNARYSRLISDRFNNALNYNSVSYLRRFLITKIYPSISLQAHQGLTSTFMPFLSDDAIRILKKDGYVIKNTGALQIIDWGDQNWLDDCGKIIKISSIDFNRKRQGGETIIC